MPWNSSCCYNKIIETYRVCTNLTQCLHFECYLDNDHIEQCVMKFNIVAYLVVQYFLHFTGFQIPLHGCFKMHVKITTVAFASTKNNNNIKPSKYSGHDYDKMLIDWVGGPTENIWLLVLTSSQIFSCSELPLSQ